MKWTFLLTDCVAGKFSGQQLRLIFYLLKQVWLMAELLSPAPNRPRHSAQHYRQAFLRCAKTNLLIMLEFILRPEFSGKILARYLQTIPRLKGKYSNITTRTFVCRKLWFLERLWSLWTSSTLQWHFLLMCSSIKHWCVIQNWGNKMKDPKIIFAFYLSYICVSSMVGSRQIIY